MQSSKEENLKVVQKWIPEATLETLKDLDDCMNTDAIYKHGLPSALISTLLAAIFIPAQLRHMKPVLITGTALLSFMFGRIVYGGTKCHEKVFGPLIAKNRKSNLKSSTNFIDDINQENQQNRSDTFSDKLSEDDSSWTKFDSFSDSNVNYFDDTGNNFQDDFPVEQLTELPVEQLTEQPVEQLAPEKKRITYDDLWAQHKGGRMKRNLETERHQ